MVLIGESKFDIHAARQLLEVSLADTIDTQYY